MLNNKVTKAYDKLKQTTWDAAFQAVEVPMNVVTIAKRTQEKLIAATKGGIFSKAHSAPQDSAQVQTHAESSSFTATPSRSAARSS